MIEYDYKIVRDEADEKRTYLPALSKELDNLVYIEGPNSSGKSTLLHIIALALFGLTNKGIHDTLQRKLRDLIGAEHQKLSFRVRLTKEDGGLELIAEKPHLHSAELSVVEIIEGKRHVLTAETFDRRYKLIYDIPDNPTERLKELTSELKQRQEFLGRKLTALKIFLKDAIKDVQNARDPEKLERFRKELVNINAALKTQQNEKERLSQDLQFVKRYYYSRYYIESLSQAELIERDIMNHRKTQKGVVKEAKVVEIRTKELAKEGKELIKQIRESIAEVTHAVRWMNIKMKEDYTRAWADIELEKMFLHKENHAVLFDGIAAIRYKVKELDADAGSEEQLQEARMLHELIDLLGHYVSVKTTIPGTNETIPEFIKLLEERYKDRKHLKISHDKYQELLQKLDVLETSSRKFIEEFLSEFEDLIQQKKTIQTPVVEVLVDHIQELEAALQKARERHQYYRDEMIRAGVQEADAVAIVSAASRIAAFRPYVAYDDKDFEEKLGDLDDEIQARAKKLGELSYTKTRHEHEVERLEEQKPHEYQEKLPQLRALFDVVQRLEQRLLNEFDGYIRNLSEHSADRRKVTAEEREYQNSVGRYLAKRVKTIRHVDGEYAITSIDLVQDVITTNKGKKIHLRDLGTGQSQSAYLKGLLNVNDGRKTIALIDEVAMMDSESMKPIYDLLQKQYRDGTLLAGILVQRGAKLCATSLLQ